VAEPGFCVGSTASVALAGIMLGSFSWQPTTRKIAGSRTAMNTNTTNRFHNSKGTFRMNDEKPDNEDAAANQYTGVRPDVKFSAAETQRTAKRLPFCVGLHRG